MAPPSEPKYAPVAVPVTEDGSALDETLVASAVDTVSPDATPYLEVVGPATLPEVRSDLCNQPRLQFLLQFLLQRS